MSEIDFAFLDSGTGGIPYMLALKEKRPDCKCVYLGDTEHFPYGEKTPEEVTECASASIKKIVERWKPKTVIIACNTISVTALDQLRALFPDLPIVGTVPAIKLASKVTKNKNIGLLATNATVNHPYSARLIQDYASDCNVFSRGDPELISFIEHDYFTATHQQRIDACAKAVSFFKEHECDTIILGCTHFCHMAEDIAEAAGSDVTVIDSRDGVTNRALEVEAQKEIEVSQKKVDCCCRDEVEDMSFFVTGYKKPGDEEEYRTLCSNFNIPWGGLI